MGDYFISRDGQQMLVELLREIPGLVEDLSVTLTRQDRTGKGDMKISSGDCTQPLPINMAASDAKDGLRNELATWARLVCDSRRIAYDGDGSVLGIARWLDENVISVAMTEGSEEAYVSIEAAMKRCRRAMDIPADDDVAVAVVDVAQARNAELNAAAIGLMRHQLGVEDLNARRVETLRKAGMVEPVRLVARGKRDIAVYRLGDVLDAHEQFPSRTRKEVA